MTRLQIENYKSLETADINFHPRVTVLVGRNNSGKSNIIDALGFLHSLTSGNSQQAVADRGGFESIAFNHDPKRAVRLCIELDGVNQAGIVRRLNREGVPTENLVRLGSEGTWGLQYDIKFGDVWYQEIFGLRWGASSFPMAKGSFSANTYRMEVANFPVIVENLLSGGDLNHLEAGSTTGGMGFAPGFRSAGPANRHLEAFLNPLQEALRNLSVRVGPVRNPSLRSPISGQANLSEGGSNLADWADYLRSNEPQRFAEFVREFVTLVPEATGVTTPRLGGPSTTVSIAESWLPDVSGFDLSASSFGERNLLVILGFLLERRPAVVLSIEEPENSLHPQALRVLARTFWRFSERQQLLISTHSATVVSGFPVESVRLVSRDAAASTVAEIDVANVRLVVNELGVKPGDVYDEDAIAFVEGETDEAVFSTWFRMLQHLKEWSEYAAIRVQFVGVKGLTNIPFHLDARLLHARSVKPELFAITDGDVTDSPEKQEQWRMVQRGIGLPPERILKLENRHTIEDYLLLPEAIQRAFPSQFASIDEVREKIRTGSESGPPTKNLLAKLLETKGVRYNVRAASQIAHSLEVSEIQPFIKDLLLKVAVAGKG